MNSFAMVFCHRTYDPIQSSYQWCGMPWGEFAASIEFIFDLEMGKLPWYVSEVRRDERTVWFKRSEYVVHNN